MQNFVLLIFLFGLGFADDVPFPMWPHWFANFNAETFGMGDVNLFATGPVALLHNPANLDTIFCFSSGLAYELRELNQQSFWKDENIGYYPQSVGFTIPHIMHGAGGILFDQPLKWRGSAGDREGSSNLMRLSLGYRYSVTSNLNLGVAVNYVWGKSEYHYGGDWNSIDFSNTYGLGIMTSSSLSLNKSTTLAMRLTLPTFLRGTGSYQSPDTTYTNNIKDNIPWEISIGIKHNLKSPLTIASQITYRNWRRGSGGFIWGDHEWQFNGGLEFKFFNHLKMNLGTFFQQFYSDLNIPFLKFLQKGRVRALFLTGSIGLRTAFLQADLGIGKSFFVEHTSLNFYPKRSLIVFNITIPLEKLLKKQ